MPWKHVFAPAKGMMTNSPPSGIPPEASPYIKGMYVKDGEAISDFGYVDFPTAGALKTNALNGSVMKIDQFYLLNGNSYLIALTTTNAYQYNTSTETWDDISWGTDIDQCELAWTASANVTSTADTAVKLHGTYSAKHVIASAFTTGLASYYDTGAKDISDTTQHTHLMFWAYSTVAVAAGVLRIRLSEEIGGGVGATYADYDVPALVANTWKHCIVDITSPAADNGGTYPDDLNAVLSVGLVANSDPGAATIYLDHIKAGFCFTGDEDNRFSVAQMNDTFICTNGVDHPQKYSGTGTMGKLTTTLAAGAITTAEIAFTFKDHLCLMNNTENAADCPQRVSWTNIGSTEDHLAGTAGYQDLVDDVSWIIGAAILSENEVIIYKERSIVSMIWVGGHTPFRFRTMVEGTGALSKDAIDSGTGEHLVVGPDVTFAYKGGTEISILDDKIKKTMYGRLNRQYVNRAFVIYIEEDDEFQLWIPTEEVVPDEVWCTNVVDETWYRKYRTMTCAGYYQEQSSFTIGDLVGTIGDQNWRFGDALTKAYSPTTLCGDDDGYVYKLDKTTLNNNGTAIVNEFQTPDFVLPDSPDYMNKFMRVMQFIFEAAGQSVTTHYSIDSGNTWNPTQGAGGNVTTLTSVYDTYQQDFDTTPRKIRFRFRNDTASSGFNLRYYGFYWIPRSGRR